MIIAHVIFSVAEESRDLALETLLGEVAAVRAMEGCVAFLPFLDPTNPQGLGVVHEWQTAEDFAQYAASASFANSGAVLRPLMVGPPSSKRFDAQLMETVN